jgi:SNF2 family DNA or RNA helicase
VALCSLRAAGHGINLTAANHVFHVDRWWNPAVEDQATDRVHRIGQDRTVYVYRILTQGTLEERICRILERKKGIAESVIGAVTGAEMRWTREELLELLRPLDDLDRNATSPDAYASRGSSAVQ